MKRLLTILLLLAAPLLAQRTTVTATVKDPVGNLYANGSYNIVFVNVANATDQPKLSNFGLFPTSVVGFLDSNATMTVVLTDLSQITPSGGQWNFSICNSAGTICFNTNLNTITGNSVDITTALQAAAAPLLFVSHFGNLTIGQTTLSSNATAARTFILPDANSNPVQSSTAGANQFANGISSAGVIAYAQPSFGNLSGSITLAQTPLTNRGDLLFATTATPVLGRLGVGAAGTVLIGGTEPSYSANPTVSSVILSGGTSGTTTVQPTAIASGTLTLPAATDTLIGKATADILTNKTYDTAGTGNVFKINGTSITSISGNTAKVATASGTLTSAHLAAFDASGNIVDGGVAGTTPTATLKTGSGAGNYTTASTTYVRVDSTNLAYTVSVPNGSKLMIHASGALGVSTAAATINVALADGGADNTGILVETRGTPAPSGASSDIGWALNWVLTGDGASHTINLQFLTSNASDAAIIRNSSATLKPQMTFLLTASN